MIGFTMSRPKAADATASNARCSTNSQWIFSDIACIGQADSKIPTVQLGYTGRLELGKGMELQMIVLARGVPDVNNGRAKGKKPLNVTKVRPVKKSTSQSTRTKDTKKQATPRLQASTSSVVIQPPSCCYYGLFRRRETANRSRASHSQKMCTLYLWTDRLQH